jgi:hypothetical protein
MPLRFAAMMSWSYIRLSFRAFAIRHAAYAFAMPLMPFSPLPAAIVY